MIYNLIIERQTETHTYKLYELVNVEWGKKLPKRYFVEKWANDKALEPQIALEEKLEYKSRTSAMAKMRKAN